MRSLTLALVAAVVLAAPVLAHAQDSTQNGSRAIGAASEAAGALTASGVQTASAVAVLPALVGGSVLVVGGASVAGAGSAVGDAAGESARAASGAPNGFDARPLKVDRRVVVAQAAPAVPYAATPAPKP